MTSVTWLWKTKTAVVAALCVLGASACSDDDSSEGGGGQAAANYPRNVEIEYKVTSTTGLAQADILYVNESGGNAIEDKVPLPFSKKFTRSVKQYDNLGVSVTSVVGGSLTSELFVDGKMVETKTFSGTSIVTGSAVYLFP